MMRQSLIAITILSALAYSGSADATVGAGNSSVSPGATAQSTPITYTARALVTGVGFDANVTDANNITVNDMFQVTTGAGVFVACDGSERVQADFNTGITCSATGVYSIRTLDNSPVGNLTTNMRVLYDVAAGAVAGQTATVGFGPYCTGVQTPASDGCVAFFLADASRQAAPTPPTSVDGTITVSAAPAVAPSIVFNPNGGAVNLTAPGGANAGTTSNATAIVVTAAGGSGGGIGGYNCTVPANFQVTNSTNAAIIAGTDPADMSVTCTLTTAVQNANMTCTRTGADTSSAVFNLSCPAGVAVPAPVLASTPPNGTPLSCNGAAGSTQTTQVTIQNTGNANMTGVSCNVVGAGFVLTTPPAAIIPGPGSSNAVVTCTVPADGAPANSGTLNCTTTAPAGGALSFPLSSIAQSAAVPTQPAIIPASSLWTKIGLIGLLAALGMLMVGFRRQQ